MTTRFAHWRVYAIVMLIVGAIAWGIHHWTRLPIWPCAGIAVAAWLVNGWIAMVVDE